MGRSGSGGQVALAVPIDHDMLAGFAGHLADLARARLVRPATLRPPAELKAERSFVTALDREIERALRLEIVARFPDHGIIGEEEGQERPDAAIQWVLDPIDGTAPFIAGIPVYGTLIAVAVDSIPVIGVMDLPAANNRWVGVAGSPTTHNGAPCRVQPSDALSSAIMACMNPDFFAPEEAGALQRLREQTAWRIYGGSSMGYGQLASGRLQVCLDTRLQVYDFACYRPIIEGAGGIVTDWQGAPITLATGPRILAAASPRLADAARAVIGAGQGAAFS